MLEASVKELDRDKNRFVTFEEIVGCFEKVYGKF